MVWTDEAHAPNGARKRDRFQGVLPWATMSASVSESSWTRWFVGMVVMLRWVVVWLATRCPSAASCARIVFAFAVGAPQLSFGSEVGSMQAPLTKNTARMFSFFRYVESSDVRVPGPSSNVSASCFAPMVLLPT